jgi:hypothetical protein
MATEYQIHHEETGSFGEHDKYWTLVVPENGEPIVRFDRSWGNPHRGEVTEDPPQLTPLNEFLTKSSGIVQEKLTKLLRRLRIDPDE